MTELNTYDFEQEVRGRIHDLDRRVYSEAAVLKAGDDALRTIFDLMRTCGEGHSLDREDVAPTAMTQVAVGVREYQLPYYARDIQAAEALYGSGSSAESRPILRAGLEDKDVGRRDDTVAPRWHYSRGQSAVPSIQIRGNLDAVTTVRFWFVRGWGPLCYGLALAGGTATTLSVAVGATTFGFKARNGLYVGAELEITADVTQPSNVGQVTRISGQAGTLLSGFTPALPAATNATTAWALLVPVPEAGSRLLIELATLDLLRRSGNDEEVALTMALIYGTGPTNMGLKHEFEQHLRTRSSGEPKRITNSRVYGR